MAHSEVLTFSSLGFHSPSFFNKNILVFNCTGVVPNGFRIVSGTEGVLQLEILAEGKSYLIPTSDWYFPFDYEDPESQSSEDVVFQVGCYDFDSDGIDEIVVGSRIGVTDPMIHVLKYHPVSVKEHFNRKENWKVFGPFSGQFDVEIVGASLRFPFGSHGFYKGYTWVEDCFMEKNNE